MSKSHILHIKQAALNEEAADIAAQSECYDWAVTMCFYAALHYVQGHAIFNNINIHSAYCDVTKNPHQQLIAYVQDVSEEKYGDVLHSSAYEKLFTASMKARYMHYIPCSCYSRKYFKLSFDRYFQELSIVKELVKI